MPSYLSVTAKLAFSKFIHETENKNPRPFDAHSSGKFVQSNNKTKFHSLYKPFERIEGKNVQQNLRKHNVMVLYGT